MEVKTTTGRWAACVLAALVLAGLASGVAAAPGAAKGLGAFPVPSGIALPGSPFRYQTFSPGQPGSLTVVTRANREGGAVRRWWSLRGAWFVAGVTPSTATGLSADGSRLVLVQQTDLSRTRRPPRTRLAIMRPQVRMRRTASGFPHWVDFARLPGEWRPIAISPDGASLFLSRYRPNVPIPTPDSVHDDFEVRALDTASGELQPGRVPDDQGGHPRLEGMAFSQVSADGGRWTYTFYSGVRRRPFVYALDATSGRGTRIDLPRLHGLREPYAVHLEVEDAGRTLAVVRRWFPAGRERERTLALVDTATFAVRKHEAQAYASSWVQVIGRSAEGHEIRLKQLGNPALDGRLLVVGCVRGADCATRGLDPRVMGCPDPHSNIYFVPTLDPDNTLEPDLGLATKVLRMVKPRRTIWLRPGFAELTPRLEQRLERTLVRIGREVGED